MSFIKMKWPNADFKSGIYLYCPRENWDRSLFEILIFGPYCQRLSAWFDEWMVISCVYVTEGEFNIEGDLIKSLLVSVLVSPDIVYY